MGDGLGVFKGFHVFGYAAYEPLVNYAVKLRPQTCAEMLYIFEEQLFMVVEQRKIDQLLGVR